MSVSAELTSNSKPVIGYAYDATCKTENSAHRVTVVYRGYERGHYIVQATDGVLHNATQRLDEKSNMPVFEFSVDT